MRTMSSRLITRAWAVVLAAGSAAACVGSSAAPGLSPRSDQPATTPPAAPPFTAARGWHTAATGAATVRPIVPSAIAANFRVKTPPGIFPIRSDLRRLPPRGVVMSLSVWSSTHGFDLRAHPRRELPLRFSESHPGRRFDAVPATARWYILGARVHGRIVEAGIFVNRHTPAAAVSHLIQSELDRIVIRTG
jgi:hypothetical protein